MVEEGLPGGGSRRGGDFYGGTHHSTVIALRESGSTPEEVKRASMHQTNKAFERYLQVTANELTPNYEATRRGNEEDGNIRSITDSR